MAPRGKVVWSSDPDGINPLKSEERTGSVGSPPPTSQIARLRRDRKGRGGKVVTIVEGIKLNAEERDTLARDLRIACGAGGTVRGETIEIQGDLRERLAEELRKRGYQIKLVGG